MSNIINENNINDYKNKINGNLRNTIKEMTLNRIEVAYKDLLENNKITEEMLDEIAYVITDDDDFFDYLDSTIYDEIRNYIKENELDEEEEKEDDEEEEM